MTIARHVDRILSGEQARAAAKVAKLLDKAIEEKQARAKKEGKIKP